MLAAPVIQPRPNPFASWIKPLANPLRAPIDDKIVSHISPIGLELIKRFEGFKGAVYRCPAGLWTIGYGHVVGGSIGMAHSANRHWRRTQATTIFQQEYHQQYGQSISGILSPQQATDLLRHDCQQFERAVHRLIIVPLTQGQFDALVSFTYNLGSGALQASTLRRVINKQHYDQVPQQFMRWIYARGQRLPGLIRRRQAEVDRFGS